MQMSKAGQRYAWPVRRSVVVGMLAAGGMALVYSVVVAGASGSLNHLTDQVREDWYLLAPIISGFGVQIGLLAELRRRRSLVREAAEVQTTQSGGVEITATLVRLDSEGALVQVVLDAHAVELDLDIADNATLIVGRAEWGPPSWDGDGAGGHHRQGQLIFP